MQQHGTVKTPRKFDKKRQHKSQQQSIKKLVEIEMQQSKHQRADQNRSADAKSLQPLQKQAAAQTRSDMISMLMSIAFFIIIESVRREAEEAGEDIY